MRNAANNGWKLHILPTAFRKIQFGPPKGLPSAVAFAVLGFINGPLQENPYRVGNPLCGELFSKHVARRGDYRVIYEIGEDNQQIFVFDVDYRGHIYHRH